MIGGAGSRSKRYSEPGGYAMTSGRIAFWGTLGLIILAGGMIFLGDGPTVHQYGIALLILTGIAILVLRRFGAG
jgi:hypothetical protein